MPMYPGTVTVGTSIVVVSSRMTCLVNRRFKSSTGLPFQSPVSALKRLISIAFGSRSGTSEAVAALAGRVDVAAPLDGLVVEDRSPDRAGLVEALAEVFATGACSDGYSSEGIG